MWLQHNGTDIVYNPHILILAQNVHSFYMRQVGDRVSVDLGGDNTKCDGTIRWIGKCTHKKLKDKDRIGIELDNEVLITILNPH